VPSPGSGYNWDPFANIDILPLAPAPDWLVIPEPRQQPTGRPGRPSSGLSAYAEAALDRACRQIIEAPAGEQEATLNSEAYSLGRLAGTGGIPIDFARRTLLWAAHQVRSYDPHRPWRPSARSTAPFDDGLRRPREVCRG
jgi:hypothetical protein